MIEFINSPGFLSARSTLGSDISYFFAVTFTVLFLFSGHLAQKRKGLAHHRMILVSMVAMLAYFVYYYEVRKLGVASFTDQIQFAGPEWIYRQVFRPVMFVHFLVVTCSVFLAIYMIINGFRTAERSESGLVLVGGGKGYSPAMWSAGLAWFAFLIWWVFSVHSFNWNHKLMFLTLGYGFPAMLAIVINRMLPDLERRHRVLGKVCLIMFAFLLATSTLAYYLLYVAEY